MLSLTRKADYALVALVSLAHRAQRGEGPISARQIARTFGLPEPVLMSTLKALARHGLVRSQRGVAGGYELAGDAEQITLLDVVRAMQGEPAPTAAEDAAAEDAAAENEASEPGTAAAVERLAGRVNGFLAGLTIADLLAQSSEAGGETGGEAGGEIPGETLVALRTAADT